MDFFNLGVVVCLFVFHYRPRKILQEIVLSSISIFFIHIYTRLFENLKAKILKSTITWSEMGQQTAQAKKAYKPFSAMGHGVCL